jgi:hypothetical protein
MILIRSWPVFVGALLSIVPYPTGIARGDANPATVGAQADQPAETKLDPAERQRDGRADKLLFNPLDQGGFVRDLIRRLRTDVDKLPAEKRPEKRAAAQKRIVQSYGGELRNKRLTLHFPIRDIERPSDRYVIKLEPPQETDAIEGRQRFLKQLTVPLSAFPHENAPLFRPGDIVELSGTARLRCETNTSGSGTQQSLPVVFVGPDVDGRFYGVYLDDYKPRLVHR